MMDVTLRLRELRRIAGITQEEIAKRSGLGVKTVSSLECGARIDSLRVADLRKLLDAYGMSEAEFFSEEFEQRAIENSILLPSRARTAPTHVSRLFAALSTLDDISLAQAVRAIEKFAAARTSTEKGARRVS